MTTSTIQRTASFKQVSFIRSLSTQRLVPEQGATFAEQEVLNLLDAVLVGADIASREASDVIDYLLRRPRVAAVQAVTEGGVYVVDGQIFKVQQNKRRTAFYALRWVESGAERVTEAGTFVSGDYEYTPRRRRLDPARAQDEPRAGQRVHDALRPVLPVRHQVEGPQERAGRDRPRLRQILHVRLKEGGGAVGARQSRRAPAGTTRPIPTNRGAMMGDRANIFVVDNDPTRGIYLYTHWNGHRWPEALRKALDSPQARDRWDDPAYLTRIVATQVFADLGASSTGGGISTWMCDSNRPVIVLDVVKGTVAFANHPHEHQRQDWYDQMSFDEFTAQEKADYPVTKCGPLGIEL